MEQKKMGARGFLSGFSRFTQGLVGAFLGLFGVIALWRGLLPEEIFPYDYWALLLLLLGPRLLLSSPLCVKVLQLQDLSSLLLLLLQHLLLLVTFPWNP